MAPFLVILLLLALGVGIVAWHTTGPAVRQPPQAGPGKPRPRGVGQDPGLVEKDLASADAEPFFRPADPFANAPAPSDRKPPE